VPKDTHRTITTDRAQLDLPEQVTVAVSELAGAAREGLLALAVGTGLQVLEAMLEDDVARLVGPKGRHNPDRAAVRHGSQPGQVTLGGRRVRVRRPRVRTADGAGEVAVPTYQVFAAAELLDQLAVEKMLAKLSTRRYRVGLEPVGTQVAQASSGTSKSAVSRRFVARIEHALAELLAAALSELDLVALLVDGIRVAEHTCVVALGITIDGIKVPLALAEGATENTTVVTELLVGLRDRGLEVTRPILVVIDGAKALRRAVTDVFDHPVIQRCQLHKLRNVGDRLPDAVAPRWPSGCGPPTTTPTRCWPRPTWKSWRASWTAPTPVPRRRSARGSPRPSRSAGWACRRPCPDLAQHQLDRVDDRDLP
jgi:putative transposase